MYCSKCGKEIADGIPYCHHCGNKISQNTHIGTPQPKKGGCGRKIGTAVVVLIMFSAFVNIVRMASEKSDASGTQPAASTSDTLAKEEPKTKTVEVKRAPISEYAIYKYPETAAELKKKGFPKMLKKYGVEGIKKINRLMPSVAEKAATNASMDRIIRVDVSDNRSTKEKLVFYADAENNNRIYITEQELSSDAPVRSNQEILQVLLPMHEQMCEAIIKKQLTYPSTYDKHVFDSISETQDYTNVIRIAFSAKNAYNIEQDYVAIFRVNDQSEVVYQDIREKQ